MFSGKQFTIEHLLYILIFLFALSLRWSNLGLVPLSDFESGWALQALEGAKMRASGSSGAMEIGANPAYILLTGLSFFIFKSTDTIARFWPVLGGAALVFFPFFFRNQFGRRAALLAAFGLALDPGLVSVSRLAGGPMLALCFALLALGTWFGRKPVAAGIFAGLALLSGPSVLLGAFGLGLAWVAAKAFDFEPDFQLGVGDSSQKESTGPSTLKSAAISFGLTLLFAGTLFLRFPQGVGALGAIFPVFFSGWVGSAGVPVNRILIALVAYQPYGVIFGSIFIVRAWLDPENRLGRFLSVWFAAALLLVIVYPGRQAEDLIWVLVPLLALAGIEIVRYLEDFKNPLSWTLAISVMAILATVWLNLAAIAGTPVGSRDFWLRMLVLLGAVSLIALSTMLVGFGWEPDFAWRGLVWGSALSFVIFLAAAGWIGPRFNSTQQEIWGPSPRAGEMDLALNTLGDLGEWSAGRRDNIEIVVKFDSPSVRWALRDFPKARFESTLGTGEQPAVVITRQDSPEPVLSSTYRGQDLIWWVNPLWDAMSSQDWFNWFVFRTVPTVPENVIVWARTDIFPQADSPLIELLEQTPSEDFIPEEEIPDIEQPVR